MSDRDKSRIKQYEKRRRNNKFITYFAMIAAVLVVILIGTWIFGGEDEEIAKSPTEQSDEDEEFFLETEDTDENENTDDADNEPATDTETTEDNEETNEEEDTNENENENSESENEERDIEYQDVVVEQEESEDENVIEAYTGNWPPIGTEQTGPHTTVYADGSQDRIEIKKAVSYVTGIPEEEVIELWIGNGGDQKVIATVTDSSQLEIFRVYLSWIDEEGWQPTRFEVLHENDA